MNDTKVTLIWHRKSTFESTKIEQVDQLLLMLQAAYLEDIITVTNVVVAHVRGQATFESVIIHTFNSCALLFN